MQTHDDRDAPRTRFLEELFETDESQRDDKLRRLEQRAAEMMKNGSSHITAGDPPVAAGVFSSGALQMSIQKLPDDPDSVLRISIGKLLATNVSYLVFRGDKKAIAALIDQARWALDHAELKPCYVEETKQ